MGQVTVRTGLTSQGDFSFNPWDGDNNAYAYLTINKGNNFITKLEIVSALNSFNLARWEYHYNYSNCTNNYNPKVYLSAVQSVATSWNNDNNSGLKSDQKSGSWPINSALNHYYNNFE